MAMFFALLSKRFSKLYNKVVYGYIVDLKSEQSCTLRNSELQMSSQATLEYILF